MRTKRKRRRRLIYHALSGCDTVTAGGGTMVKLERREHVCGQEVHFWYITDCDRPPSSGFDEGDTCPRCAGRLNLDTTRAIGDR